ncbi:MAG: outer membrane beta-barrel protein, partial [Chitinophagaceae bacterium]|nr:outer membrane beta-barrel protein [Chitinophagaceae bacterium]
MQKILRLLGLVLLGIISTTLYAQKISIKGTVTDTSSKQNLNYAVVALLQAKDSIMVKFTRTAPTGAFELKNIDTGNYILLITSPNYADYVDRLALQKNEDIDLHNISVITKAHLLQEVVVTQTVAAIKIKGDTTEFVADSFHVQPNATVEDLLKKLPGIQVDKDGKITAQGETVKKVLVDGEEFFGDDPTLVTKNFRADMVDKVQLYDKKSDQAAFTGIDDGVKDKTLNLKLKEDKKNGYFGKLVAGVGLGGYHDSQGMFNKFKKKMKFSAYGIVSNTGTSGLNWQDQGSYGGGNENMQMTDDGGMMIFFGGGNSLYDGKGIPLVQTGGIHFDNKWNDDKESINLNYKIANANVSGTDMNIYENKLPGFTSKGSDTTNFQKHTLRNKVDATYEVQLDSSSSLKVYADGTLTHVNSVNNVNSGIYKEDSTLTTYGHRNNTSTGDAKSMNNNILWRKKFKKKGRTLSLNVNQSFNINETDGYLDYKYNFSGVDSSLKQYQPQHTRNYSLAPKATYTEPLSDYGSLVVNYGINLNNSTSDKKSYNQDAAGNYTLLDSTYSNNYRYDQFSQRTGLYYNYSRKKIRYNFGSDIAFTNFKQTNYFLNSTQIDTALKRSFVNFYPQARFTYAYSNAGSVGFNYNGNTTQPSISQIQPFLSNSNPLYVTIGNPNLKPSFTNNFSMWYSTYKVLSQRSFYANINYSSTLNAFASQSSTDTTTGKTTSQTVNVNGNRSFNFYGGYWFKWKKPDMRIGFNGRMNANRYQNYVAINNNNVLNTTNSGSYSLSMYVGKYKEKVFDNSIRISATYNTSTSTVQNNNATNYWSYNIRPDLDFFLPAKFQIHTDIDFQFQQKNSSFGVDRRWTLWNAWIGKK